MGRHTHICIHTYIHMYVRPHFASLYIIAYIKKMLDSIILYTYSYICTMFRFVFSGLILSYLYLYLYLSYLYLFYLILSISVVRSPFRTAGGSAPRAPASGGAGRGVHEAARADQLRPVGARPGHGKLGAQRLYGRPAPARRVLIASFSGVGVVPTRPS